MLVRTRDISIGMMLLLLSSPFIIAIAVCIVLDSGFPVFFRQRRIGRNGIPFTLLKFRTMRPEPAKEQGFHPGDDFRVTRFGRVLRRLKLDELPQLINVIRGDMGLVGPRPEVSEWVEKCPSLFNSTLKSRPGITDPAAIVFRSEGILLASFENPQSAYETLVLPAKLDLSARYLLQRTGMQDLIVLWATLAAVFGLPHPWSHIDASALLQARRDRLDAEGCG